MTTSDPRDPTAGGSTGAGSSESLAAGNPGPAGATTGPGLGLWMAAALVVGNMIGSGVFLLPSSLAPYGGISIVGWLFTATGAMLLALVFARLGRQQPRVGGPYAYTRAAFGDFAGFVVGWGYWISIWVGNAAIAVAFAGYLGFFWPRISHDGALAGAIALAAVWLLTVVNSAGVRQGGRVQVVTTALKLLPLVGVAAFGLALFHPANFQPFNRAGGSTLGAVSATAALTLWAFLGLESATVPAGDVRDPDRTIPRATILGTVFSAVLYIAATAAVMGIVPPASLESSTAPFADAAQAIWGQWAGAGVAAGAAISSFGALNGWILLQGQVPMAAAADGLFPAPFARRARTGAPALGLAISSVLITVLVGANYTRGLVPLFTFVVLLSTLSTLIPYLFCSLAALKAAAASGPAEALVAGGGVGKPRSNGAPARSPGFAIVAVLAFVYSAWAIVGCGAEAILWGLVLLAAGVPIYVGLRRAKAGGAAEGATTSSGP